MFVCKKAQYYYISDLKVLNEESKDIPLSKVAAIARDNDSYLGQTARFFGNTFFTVSLLISEEDTLTEEHKKLVFDKIALENIKDIEGTVIGVEDIRPVIVPILSNAAGAGFPNVDPDSDGVMRSIHLVREFEGHYFPQLAFSPLLNLLGNHEVNILKDKIILKGAVIPGEEAADINIPLTEDGRMLINWPKKYAESFRHLSYYELVLNKELEQRLIENLKNINDAGYLSYFQSDRNLIETYQYAVAVKKDILSGGDTADIQDYREIRKYFFEEVGKFLDSDSEIALLADIEAVILSDEVSEELRQDYVQIKAEIPDVFTAIRDIYTSMTKSRDRIISKLYGSFCIIGQTGTSTFDIGVNPFEEKYMNVGIHASALNTILSGSFLDDRPWWSSSILALLLSLFVMFAVNKLAPIYAVSAGNF